MHLASTKCLAMFLVIVITRAAFISILLSSQYSVYRASLGQLSHPSGVGKSSTGLSGVKAGCVHLCREAGNAM